MRDIDRLLADAAGHGDAIGAFARVVLDHPLPWTKMRQVYELLGLCRRYGDDRVEAACVRALDAETDSVTVVGRTLARPRSRHHRRRPAARQRDPRQVRPQRRPLRCRPHGA